MKVTAISPKTAGSITYPTSIEDVFSRPQGLQHALLIDFGGYHESLRKRPAAGDISDDEGSDSVDVAVDSDSVDASVPESSEGVADEPESFDDWDDDASGDDTADSSGEDGADDGTYWGVGKLPSQKAWIHGFENGYLTALESVVKTNDPPIDCVRFESTGEVGPGDLPDERTWKVLRPLRPKHLELWCGMHSPWESSDFSIPDEWSESLRSVYVEDATVAERDITARAFISIESITFDQCGDHDFKFDPPIAPGESSLRRLIVKDCSFSLRFLRNIVNSGLTDGLKELTIDIDVDDFMGPDAEEVEVGDLIKGMTSLTSLDLSLWSSETDTGVLPSRLNQFPRFIPPSVKDMRVEGVFQDLSIWSACISNVGWAPDLQTLGLFLPTKDEDDYDVSEAQARLDEFREHLAATRPMVKILTSI